jgi:hypothetical protein
MIYFENIIEWFSAHSNGVIAIGVIISAFVSIWVAHYTTSSALLNQVTALKVTWIESLRDDVATYLKMSLVKDLGLHGEKSLALQEVYESKKIFNRILLKLNLSDEKHRDLEIALRQYAKETENSGKDKFEDVVREKARVIFHEEWQRALTGKK